MDENEDEIANYKHQVVKERNKPELNEDGLNFVTREGMQQPEDNQFQPRTELEDEIDKRKAGRYY